MNHSRYMRRILIALIIAIVSFTLSCKETALPKNEHKNPLWKISSGDKSIYLLGSIHLLKKENYPLDEAIEEAFMSSDTIVLELDFGATGPQETQKLLKDKTMLQGEQSLKNVLPASTYTILEEFFTSRKLNIAQADKYKPWFLATIITISELERLGFKPHFGVDMHYYTKAKTTGKDIQALETMEFQLSLFDGLSMKMQNDFILHSIKEIKNIEQEFDVMLKAWSNGDTEALKKVLEPCKQYPEICDTIIDSRNHNWIPIIEDYIKDDTSYLVIVGAGHMIGEQGLLNLLGNKGYKIEQL